MCVCLPCHIMAQKAGDIITVKKGEEAKYFTIKEIPAEVLSRMKGRSYPKDCPVKLSDLRYLQVLHCNKDGKTQVGELVCNKAIANDLIDIFLKLYQAGYPIERMQLIDDYNASDDLSMKSNNTSCFNFRYMTGSTTRISLHGRGMAIDINPLYNPYVNRGKVEPSTGKPYATNRLSLTKGKEWWARSIITSSSLPYRLFRQHGFRWGGSWPNHKDYQHFEK